jgi:hypothetical protein
MTPILMTWGFAGVGPLIRSGRNTFLEGLNEIPAVDRRR